MVEFSICRLVSSSRADLESDNLLVLWLHIPSKKGNVSLLPLVWALLLHDTLHFFQPWLIFSAEDSRKLINVLWLGSQANQHGRGSGLWYQ